MVKNKEGVHRSLFDLFESESNCSIVVVQNIRQKSDVLMQLVPSFQLSFRSMLPISDTAVGSNAPSQFLDEIRKGSFVGVARIQITTHFLVRVSAVIAVFEQVVQNPTIHFDFQSGAYGQSDINE